MRKSQNNVNSVVKSSNVSVGKVGSVVVGSEVLRTVCTRILIALHLITDGHGLTALAVLAGRLEPAFAGTTAGLGMPGTGMTGLGSWRRRSYPLWRRPVA